MKIVGVDLHAKQQNIAMLDTETGELTEKLIRHEGNVVREFYVGLEGPVVVGLEATGSMQWFLELLGELGIQYRVGHPAKIRAAEPRKQKHDRRDARLVLYLLERDHYMPAFKVSQFADNFLLPLVELEMVIRLFLRPFMMVSDSSWFSEWPHFLVDFA